MNALDQSYSFCERIARRRARNFYYAFLVLPKRKRRAMCAIYAFMRHCDDLSDEQDASLERLDGWRRELDLALDGGSPDNILWPAFRDTVERYRIPRAYFHEMIDGVSSDLTPRRISTFDDLYRYCYLVSSIVGLTITHIFEFEDPKALDLAEKCGIAFQLTNILRDLQEDAGLNRVYFPEEDLQRFGVSVSDLKAPCLSHALRDLLRFEAARAKFYYAESRPLIGMVHQDSRSALWALIEIYRKLLARMEASGYDVVSRRISLPAWQKAAILLRARAGHAG